MKTKRYNLLIISFLIVLTFTTIVAYANSAEPPALIVIMKNVPDNISVSIVSQDNIEEGIQKKIAWETYYAFYKRSIGKSNEITLRASGNDTVYNQIVTKDYFTGYNNIITLDFKDQSIVKGKLLSRSIILVTLRVSFTLIIEGIIFFLFWFRNKKSWIAFLFINLVTQGILNIFLNGAAPFTSYLFLNLIFMEFFVFVAEIFGIIIFIKEHSIIRRVVYVLVANLVSLILGGYMITLLPV